MPDPRIVASHCDAKRVVLLAFWLLLISGSEIAVAEEAEVRVSALRFEGVAAVDEKELRDHMLTTPRSPWPWVAAPRPFDEDTLREDLDRIAEVYARHGFHGARSRYELSWSDDRTEVVVQIDVLEGEPVLLRALDLDLVDVAPQLLEEVGEWKSALALREGERFSVPAYIASKESLLAKATGRGFLDARLEGGAEVDPRNATARVRWKLVSGPRVGLGELRIVGLASVAPILVRREVALVQGDLLTPGKLRQARRAVYDTGLFRTVSVKPLAPTTPSSSGSQLERRDLEIRVEERPPRSLRAGLGYGTEDGPRARLGWQHRNWHGGGRQLDFEGKYSSRVYGFSTGFRQPRSPDASSEWFVRAHALREDEPGYAADRFVVGPGLEKRFGKHLVARIGVAAEWSRLLESVDESPSRLDLTDGTIRLGYLDLGLRWADLDDLLNPTRGVQLELAVEPATRLLGSEVGFLRGTAQARAYVPVGPLVAAFRFKLGTAQPFEGDADRDVPVFKRFFTGGSTSVRGFDYHDIGPEDEDGDPIGGLSLLEASAELRFPLVGMLGGVVFADAGRVGRRPFDFWGELSVSAGAGLRYQTPLGPIRLDVAHPLAGRGGADRVHVHFSIGHAF